MKCICNSKSKDLIISIKDDNVVFQTCNNTKNVIRKFQGLFDFSDSNVNQIIRLMSQISCKNIDKNSFKQILEINTNCSNHSEMFINNDTNFRLVSSTHSTSANSPKIKETKKKKSKNQKTNNLNQSQKLKNQNKFQIQKIHPNQPNIVLSQMKISDYLKKKQNNIHLKLMIPIKKQSQISRKNGLKNLEFKKKK
ncbi:unnamed protein product [Paramecium octaurelia]|uniref:Uncharacterized protein n=1 Tax=Paramecium octaurelia TaxID=43137 RepID=A0A8S1UGM2_PAROT|nr:unnamed protein product [Paramecium octaurelia]